MTLKQVIEALVFASPKPLPTEGNHRGAAGCRRRIRRTRRRGLREGEGSRTSLARSTELQAEYAQTGRAFQLVEQVNGWSLVTDPAAAPWVRQLYPEAKPTRLSGPALETLAIIAYRQPVTRADIEAVRGVAVDGVMQVLLDRGLVKIAGRAEVPGRPLLYETTEYFLQHFGLKTVDELPNVGELRRIALPKAAPPEKKGGKAKKRQRQRQRGSRRAVSRMSPAPDAEADGACSDRADGSRRRPTRASTDSLNLQRSRTA